MAGPEGTVAAGLTLYRPDRAIFDALLSRVREEAAHVFVLVDGAPGEAVEPDHLGALRALAGVTVLPLEDNAGIARGLNRLARAARDAGHGRILFFDQDSEPGAGLASRLDEAMTALHEAGHRPAALGPRPVAAAGSGTRAPRYRPRDILTGTLRSVDFVIVSGSLVDLAAFEAVGPFREALRMDGVDLEWGFRAWSRGRSIWVDEGASLPHRVGTGLVRFGPIRFPRQSEARMANYVRSQAMLLRMPHVPTAWKGRQILYVPLQIIAFAARSGSPLACLRRLSAATVSGVKARHPKDSVP